MGTTPAAKTRSFCLLLVLHTAQVLSRTIMVALLVMTQGWFAAVYLGSDLLVFLIAKAARVIFSTGCRTLGYRSRCSFGSV